MLLAVLLFLIVPLDGPAAEVAAPQGCSAPPSQALLAWSFKGFFIAPTRTRIVQICVVVMSLALFIMMRKLTDEGPARPRPRDARNKVGFQPSSGSGHEEQRS